MIQLRKILFYIFFAIYLIFLPQIIFYALGISFRPKTQTILRTGLIHLTTIPPGARVYINQRVWSEKTPTTIRNLVPRQYSLRLVKKDYKSWSRTLPVFEEKATAVEDILLIPKVWQPHTLSLDTFESLMTIKSQPFLILKRDASLNSLFVLTLDQATTLSKDEIPHDLKNHLRPISFPPTLAPESKIKRQFSVPKSPFLLFEIEHDKKYRYFWVDLRQAEIPVRDVTDLFPEPPEHVLWDAEDDNILFALGKNVIHQLDIHALTIYPKIIENVHNFTVFNHRLYILTQDHILRRFAYGAKEPEVLLDDKELSETLFGEGEKWQISVLTNDIIVFWDERGTLLTNRLPYYLVDKGIKDFVFDETTQRLLVWTSQRIGIVDFVKEETDGAFEEGPQLTWLTDKGRKIEQASWSNKATYVIFQDNNKISLIEAFKKFRSDQIHEITGIQPRGTSVYFEPGLLLYLHPKTKKLSFIELIPSERPELPVRQPVPLNAL